jgi:hypothetical protein
LFWIASTFSSIGLGRFFYFFLFLICLKEVFVGRQHLKIFCAVGDSAEKYKMAISEPKPYTFGIFGLVPKSPTHTGMLCVKTQEPSISSLGPFNNLHAKNLRRGDQL